jgi:hypothetical protein
MDDPSKPSGNLDPDLTRIRVLDLDRRCEFLGLDKSPAGYVFPFFNRRVCFDGLDFIDLSGEEVTPAVKEVLCRYALGCPDSPVETSARLVTLREFPDSGPLFSRFTENKNKTIEQNFSGRLQDLNQRCHDLGGNPFKDSGYDVSVEFSALPAIPIVFHFNDKDEALPARAAFLFKDNANRYLDLKSLGILATYLTGLMIQ